MEENLLLAKTFLILGGMLVLTTIASRINKAYETSTEAFVTIGGSFGMMFLIIFNSESYPLNLVLVGIFSLFIGWSLGPTIAHIGEKFKFRKYLKDKMVLSKTVTTKKTTFTDRLLGQEDEKKTVYYYKSEPEKTFDRISDEFRELKLDFEKNILPHDRYNQEWQNVVFQAMLGTTLAVIIAGSIVALVPTDFSFLGIFLWISLLALIFMEILNAFVTKFDDHPRKADGLYKLALAKVNLEELDLAETLLQEVISNYPNSGAALLAEQDLIKLNPQ